MLAKTTRKFRFISSIIWMLCLPFAGCSPKEGHLDGSIFIVTEGAQNIKLGLVTVLVLDEQEVKASVTNIDTPGMTSAYFDNLPTPLATAKSDSDGRFSIPMLREGHYIIAARGRRRLGDQVEDYFWMLRVSLGGKATGQVMLSNDNLAKAESLELMFGIHANRKTPLPTEPSPISWQTPAGWEEQSPGELRLASFKVKGHIIKQADVSIISLLGNGGGDLNNVNRWRSQVGLPPVKEEELSKLAEEVEIAGTKAPMYDQAGENPATGDKSRILVVVLHREDTAWFFRVTGDDELVSEQKAQFVAFLKSLKFKSSK